ncbi:hypothetical protein PG984_014160 [Apiospora sp. TS-2023a]
MDDSPTTTTPAHVVAGPDDAEDVKQKMKELSTELDKLVSAREELYNELAKLVSAREDAAGSGFQHDDRAAILRASREAYTDAAAYVAELEFQKVELERSMHHPTAAQAQEPDWQLCVEENLQRLRFVQHGADARLEHTGETAHQTRESVRELDGLHAVLDVLRLGPGRFYALLYEHPAFAEELRRRAPDEVEVVEQEEPVKEE